MPYVATYSADFSKWDSALKNAQQNLKSFEVSGKGVQQQLERITKSFSGVEIRKQADIAVAAVKAIGGATKLTEAEQRKVNATVTEAIAKYRALGQVAPAEMMALARATEQVAKPTQTATLSVRDLAAGYLSGMAIWEAAKRVLGGIVDFLKSSIQSYSAAEKATAKLTQALRNSGNASDETIKDMSRLATEFQRTTRFSDDLVTEVEALFTQLGEVGPKDMKVAIQAAADLSEGLGIDLEQAATAVSKALQGNDTALRKMAPSLDEAAVKGGNLADIAGEIEKRFGGQAAAALDTYAGRVEQLANQWDNVKESIGAAIVNDELLRAVMRRVNDELVNSTDATQNLTVTQLIANNAWAQGNAPLGALLGLLNQYAASANAAAESQTFLNRTIDALSKKAPTVSLKGMFPDITAAGLAEFEKQNKLIDAGREAAKKAEAAYQEWAKSITGLGNAMAAAQLEDRFTRLNASGKLTAESTQKIIAEYEKLRPTLRTLPPILELIRTEYQKTIIVTNLSIDSLRRLSVQAIPDANRMFLAGQAALDGFQRNGNLVSRRLVDMAVQMKAVPAALFTKHIKEAAAATRSFADALKDQLLAGAADAIGILDGVFNEGLRGEALGEAIGASIGAGIGGALGAYFGGPAGAALGAQAGAAIGQGIAEMFRTNAEKIVGRTAYELGLFITEEVAQGIEDSAQARFGGNREAARIFHLDDLIREGGGITGDNFRLLFAEFRDLFSMIETGAFTSAQALEVLDSNFRMFADFVTEGGSLASKELLEIIRLADEAGLKSAEVMAFTSGQANKALAGLGTFVTKRGEIFDKLAEAQKKLGDLTARAGDDSADIDPKDIAAAASAVEKLQKQLAAIPLTKGGVDAVGASLFSIFQKLTENGQPALEVLKQIDPLIGSLDRQLAGAGLSGGAAFDSLKGLADLATDETFGPAFEAISGLGMALEGLNNSGLLNQETFEGLAGQVTETFNGLVAQGVDGEKAMRLIQPTLQDLWELQQDFGYEVDDTTQKMLDEAKAAGYVGDEHRTATEQMLKLTERMTLALEGIAKLFGVDLVGEVDKFGKAIDDLPDDVTVDGSVDWDVPPIPAPRDIPSGGDYDYGNNYEKYYAAKGGLVPKYLAGGGPSGSDTVPAWLTPGEFVMSRSAVDRVGAGTLSSMNAGSGAGDTTVAVIVLPSNASMEDLMASMPATIRRNPNQVGAKIARELQKYGVR